LDGYSYLLDRLNKISGIMRKINYKGALSIIVLIVFLMPLRLLAQVSGAAANLPVEGYVILLNGDTIFGRLRWSLKYVENNPVEIKFTQGKGSSKSYNASDIKGFGNYTKLVKKDFNTPEEMDVEYYVSMPSFKKGVPVFMNRLLNGRIIVFQNRSSIGLEGNKVEERSKIDGIAFTFTPGKGLSIGPSYATSYRIIEGRTRFTSYYVSKENGVLLKVEKSNYDSLFATLFGDCPGIDQEIAKNPDLRKFKNFMILTEVYNQICMK
jgi:hypothetical protein